MKKKVVWMVVSGWMVAALLLTSCAPAVVEEEAEKIAPKAEKVVPKEEVVPKEAAPTKVVEADKKPQYGGVFTGVVSEDPRLGFEMLNLMTGSSSAQWYTRMTGEPLVRVDRKKGPAGTGEWSGLYSIFPPFEVLTPSIESIAEKWEISQPDTVTFYIRKGVYWHDKAPTYGAELTPEDVVYSYVLRWGHPESNWTKRFGVLADLENPEKSIYVHPDNPRAVVFKSKLGELGNLFYRPGQMWYLLPKAYGPRGEGLWGWEDLVGTGPFVLTDYVNGSGLTYERNPNYWANDVLYPENRLPYVDTVAVLIIPDASTRQAAMRVGKIDMLTEVPSEMMTSLRKTNPELQMKEFVPNWLAIKVKVDRPPFDQIKVRQAAMMAINHDELANLFYEEAAVKDFWPAMPIREHAGLYVPLDDPTMPEVVREMLGYNPDKARQLLAEAGYPEGFVTSVYSLSADADLLSVIKQYWAEVGIDLKIEVRDATVFRSLGRRPGRFEGGIMSFMTPQEPIMWTASRPGKPSSVSGINDPLIEQMHEGSLKLYYFERAEYARMLREATPELRAKAYHLTLPAPYGYNIWQPWLKGYYGEMRTDYHGHALLASRYFWLDQELKKSMGH